jgi:putative peptidoglycan lipid II flippase
MRLIGVLGGLAAIQAVLGFLFQLYVVTTLGAGARTDILYAGLAVPQLAVAVVSGTLGPVITPLLSVQEPEVRRRVAWSLFQAVALSYGAVTVLLWTTAAHWAPWLAPGFSSAQRLELVSVVRIHLAASACIVLANVLRSVYHAQRRFTWPEIVPVAATGAALALAVWTVPRFGVLAAAAGMTVNAALQLLLLCPALGAYQPPRWRSLAIRQAHKRLGPLLLAYPVLKMDDLVDKVLASTLPSGTLSLLHLGQQLYDTGSSIVQKSVVSPMLPDLAVAANTAEWERFAGIVRRGFLRVVVLLSVGFALVLLLGHPLLELVYSHGQFTPADVTRLWWLLILLAGLWFGSATGAVISSGFYAQGETRTPVSVGLLGLALSIGYRILAVQRAGVAGLAAAISAYYLGNALVLGGLLIRRLGQLQAPGVR